MVPWWATLRTRLIASYVGALVLALAAFGIIAVVVIDRDLCASLDARLKTTAEAASNFVDVVGGTPRIDERDRAQLFALLGPQIDIAVYGDTAGTVVSTTPNLPAGIATQARRAQGYASLREANGDLRSLTVAIKEDEKRVGAVIAWASTDWIEATDRQVGVAFALAALLLAAVASLAGSALARRALADTFERQRRFTTDAAHELRAPLAVIRAEADLALRKPRETPAYEAALSTIASEADRMEALVGALLVAARVHEERGAQTVIDALALARSVSERLRPSADVKHIRIHVGDGEATAVGDRAALERALTAVVHNAIKHAPAGGKIEIQAQRHAGSCELLVYDDGPGFSPAALEHGLEWFWKDDATQSHDEGTGLGLAIADSIARAGGGRVKLANSPNGGAVVTLALPVR